MRVQEQRRAGKWESQYSRLTIAVAGHGKADALLEKSGVLKAVEPAGGEGWWRVHKPIQAQATSTSTQQNMLRRQWSCTNTK
jgi:hypothetical protein